MHAARGPLFGSYHIMTSCPVSITEQTTAKCYLFVYCIYECINITCRFRKPKLQQYIGRMRQLVTEVTLRIRQIFEIHNNHFQQQN